MAPRDRRGRFAPWRDGPMTRFAALVLAVCALEAAVLLWITGGLRPLG